ncbi:MAG: SAM-dependent DNA methyltransferase [Ignavibacteriales bacterium]|nr:MAG: SAM-dependent DNA methyltransferase [Ignavibacteriales bacterium]
MNPEKLQILKAYLTNIKKANKESIKKEFFKDLLNRLYAGDKEIESIIDDISKGAERAILNIPRKDKLHRGSADTLYNKIIIEFENDLKVTLKHAKEQLAGYLIGQFNSGEGYNYTLIASDFITWKVLVPDISCINKINELNEDELVLNEVKSASFVVTEKNLEEFYYWIDRFLFKEERQKATLKRIEEAFGYQGSVFIECNRELTNHFNNVKKFGEVQVSFEQWSKFLSIAYGSFNATEETFLIHTYLSIFSKMLAYSVVSNDDYISDEEMKGIIDGSIFFRYNIRNFVDDDFFHWIKAERNFKALKKVFRLIAQEISTFNFSDVDEDILKGVYQELIDLDTRHTLGEYYTPDWLCERVLKEFELKEGSRILDPACGSGSFLIAAIHRLRELNPDIPVEELNGSIYGIDIHPLSVQIAKTNILLALGKQIINARTPVHLNIILANTLLAPDGVEDLFGNSFKMKIDRETLELSSQILTDVKIFDESLELCEELAEQTLGIKKTTIEGFEKILIKQVKNGGFNKKVIESFYKIYESLRSVKEKGRDSIWKFIIQNLYKPYFLSKKFDYVIGNPPWFTYSSIKNEEYQDILNDLADQYNVKPERIANFPNLEIAAIFLAYCSSYFLKDKGEIAFVLPRSFFSADHHNNTRSGKAKGFRLKSIWDFNEVSPLFRVPSGVLFAVKEKKEGRSLPASGLSGKTFSGTLKQHNCKLEQIKELITEENSKWFYVKHGNTSAFSTKKSNSIERINIYKNKFKKGAELTPRTFYFVELNQDSPNDWKERIINIKTSDEVIRDAKIPWKSLTISGRIESRFLFRTALAKSILPFALYKPDLVTLPVTIETNETNEKKIILHSADDLMSEGYLNASRWIYSAERYWDLYKTSKNKNITSVEYLNWHNKLCSQNLNAPYLVLYNSSAKDANATIVKRRSLDLEFFVDTKAYVYYTNSKLEANYLVAILNSSIPNKLMKDFQSKGLFGARDVHKKILDIYFPKFDENNAEHIKLAELSKLAHEKAEQYLKDNPPRQELSAIHLGRLRVEIKKHLKEEMKEIDKIVKKII